MTTITRRRNFAVLLFVLVLVFFAAEVFLVMTAKSQHDYRNARQQADSLSVELSLISSSFASGNRTLYENSLNRLDATLAQFSENEYVTKRQAELLDALTQYRDSLTQNSDGVIALLELSAALSNIQSSLIDIDETKLDVANFYQVQQTFSDLRNVIAKTKVAEFSEITQSLDRFAERISALSSSAAVCVSVCPKESFVKKTQQLQEIKNEFAETFQTTGKTVSAKYDPSKLIVRLGQF